MHEKYPFFLHPPKTGGSSIVNALIKTNIIKLDNNTDLEQFLSDPKQLHKTFKEKNLPADIPYAISVRSPYTRYVSLYFQFCRFKNNKQLAYDKNSDAHIYKFKKFMLNTFYRKTALDSSCTCWVEGIIGKIHVIKFENLINDVKQIYNIDLTHFPNIARSGLGTKYNKTVTEQETINPILSFYDDIIITFVNEIAKSDFDMFGYTKFNNYQEMLDYVQN